MTLKQLRWVVNEKLKDVDEELTIYVAGPGGAYGVAAIGVADSGDYAYMEIGQVDFQFDRGYSPPHDDAHADPVPRARTR